ncbi:MAG: ankyrin repeat domain-containing protein [Alphaproteobacteria bacterium]|nr:ankyrin repeat domain-containing protein [Alphaproteobacteria bacterium]
MKRIYFLLPLLMALGACSSAKPLDKKRIDVFSNQGLSVVQNAFERGFSSESADDAGRTALMYAVWKNPDQKAVEFLISKSLNINAENEAGNTALMIELQKEDARLDVVNRLLRMKADVNHRNKSGISPILTAARRVKNPQIIEVLLKAGAKINDTYKEDPVNGRTPLLIAAESNKNPEIVLKLINAGADKKAVNENGENALMIAVSKNKNTDIINALIPLFDLNARDNACESVLQKLVKRQELWETSIYTTVIDQLKKTKILFGRQALCNIKESYQNRINSWSGAPLAALEKTWGKAFKSRAISEYVNEYFYGYSHHVASETGSSLARLVYGDSFTGGLLTEPAKPQYKNFCQTSFMIENGLVILAQYTGNACGGN